MVAVPLIETTVGVLAALLINESEPLMFPADEGVTVIDTLRLPPEATVAGNARSGTPKPGLLAFIAVMVAPVPPEFVRVTVREAVVPTSTEPKSAKLGEAARLATWGPCDGAEDTMAPVLPQPVRTAAE